MYKQFLTLSLVALVFTPLLLAVAQGKDGQAKPAVQPKIKMKAVKFNLQEVRLLDGPFKDALERDKVYLLALDTDRLLHNFRVNAHIPSGAAPLAGWEAPDCELRGHFTGHFLSAAALLYASTGDERLVKMGERVVEGLRQCQENLGDNGYLSAFPEEFIDRVETGRRVWAPWYTLHKIAAGLLDQYVLCGNVKSLEVLEKMAGWVKKRTDRLDDAQMQDMLKVEFGGMGEVLRNLYGVTGKKDYLALAERFDHKAFFEPLAGRTDKLKGLHANTNIPKVIAASRGYELTGDGRYRDIAEFFWHQIVKARSYSTGGTSNYEYWRGEPYQLAGELSTDTHENCCTYNMLRLTEHIYSWTGDPSAMDYYERALYNGILPTQMPTDGGALLYYVPLKPGLFKVFGIPDSSYYCCNGSGIESFAKLGNNIYHHSDDEIFVDLFIPSVLSWKEKGIEIRQETKYPEEDFTSLIVRSDKPLTMKLSIRIPSWIAGKPTVRVNGKNIDVTSGPSSYLSIKRSWKNGDSVSVKLPMGLHLWKMPDDSSFVSILYGPIVLAGELGREIKEIGEGYATALLDRIGRDAAVIDVPAFVTDKSNLNFWIKPVDGEPLTFRTVGAGRPGDVQLIPFYMTFGQRYAVYWKLYSEKKWKLLQDLKPSLPEGTSDMIIVGDKRSDEDHNFQAYRFVSGDRMNKKWVKSPFWFRYDMNVWPDLPLALKCQYWGGDKDCSFDILIDGLKLVEDSLAGPDPEKFLIKIYKIPKTLLEGRKKVAVMFRGKDNKPTCELYGCEIIKSE